MTNAAKALIFRQDKLLILRRSNTHPLYALQPDIPGGIVEPDETPEQALEREIFEEIGINIPVETTDLIYQNQIRKNTEHYIYRLSLDDPDAEIKISWEHDDYYWQTINEVLNADYPDDLDHFMVEVIELLKTL